ncbi:MAG: helix-turn-helix transcriptional regulator [Actinobacteria bacterium]|nr:helix-turn-helix transcriptional regulator [Actinomycetota bacterium]
MEETTRLVAELVGRRIRRPRRDQELSQETIAWRAEIHRTQITLIEHGERLPRIDTLVKLAGAIGMSPCDLLDGLLWEPGDRRPGRFVVPDRDRPHG